MFTSQATPTINSVDLTPLNPTNISNLTISYSTSDIGGDTVYNITDWRVEGTSIAVLNMPFDVNSSTVNDYSTYGNDGIEGGATWSSSGKVGGAFLFDGSNSEINISDNDSLIYGSNTITFWYKRSTEANVGYAWYHYTGSSDRYSIQIETDNIVIDSYDGTGVGGQYSVHSTNNDTDWHFIAVTTELPHITAGCDGNNVYFDGQLTTISFEHCAGNDATINPIADVKIGYQFEGLIDKFLFFNRVLTTDQINEIYLAGFNNHSLEKIVHNETRAEENWSVMLTATDTENEAQLLSNTVQVKLNIPVVNSVFLNSSSSYNTSVDNLTVKINSSHTNDKSIINITDWRINGTSIAVLNMPFDTNSSSSIKDYSTYDNDGTVTGPVWTDNCKVGGCYSFDGIDDYLTIPYNESLNLTTELTIVGWMNYEGSVGASDNFIIEQYNTSLLKGWYLQILNNTGIVKIKASMRLEDGTGSITTFSTTPLSAGTWYHFALTLKNNTGIGSLFLNGNKEYMSSKTTSSGLSVPQNNIQIGRSDDNIGSSEWNGSIDEISVYDRILSADQINELYLAGFNNHSLEKIIGEEINTEENWTVMVTSTDTDQEASALSNIISVTQALNFTVLLNSTSAYNFTTDNLTSHINETYNPLGLAYTNITDWRIDGNSIAVLNYPFDTDYETIVKDYSSYGNNGTLGSGSLSNSPNWTSSGYKGGAYIFDGVDDYIELENVSNLSNDITLSAWINASSEGVIMKIGKEEINSLKFFEDWESGSISSNWTVSSSNSYGDVDVSSNSDCGSPYAGSNHLILRSTSNSNLVNNTVKTNFSLAGISNLTFNFYHIDDSGDDEEDSCSSHSGLFANCDGVFFTCDGSYWYKITDLANDNTYTNYDFDLTNNITEQCGGTTNSSFSIKFSQKDDFPCSSDGRAIDNINLTSQDVSSLNLNTINGGEIRLGYDNVTYSGNLNDKNWHLITGTFTNSNLSLYVDGTYQGSTTSSNLIPTSENMTIGSNSTGSYFNGTLDEVMIYKRALSPEQISLLFQNKNLELSSSESDRAEMWAVVSTASIGSEDVYSIESNNITINENSCDSGNQFTTCYITTAKIWNGSYEFNNLIVQSGGSLTHSTNSDMNRIDAFNSVKNYWLEINATNLTIESGGLINVSGKGYSGGDHSEDNGTGYGLGGGGESIGEGGGGGGYGGQGGEGYYDENNEGITYGSVSNPADLGSGGGSGDGRNQSENNTGIGGGLVILNILDNLTINGQILADGTEGLTGTSSYLFDGSGGGSGGTISINTSILGGIGNITSVGGDGGEDIEGSHNGGGGGGGRIKVNLDVNISGFTGQTNVSGGTGPGSAGDGLKGSFRSPNLVIEDGLTETLSDNVTLNSILLSSGTLNIQEGNTITTNSLNLSTGTVNNNGTLIVNNDAIVNGSITYNGKLEVLQDLTITGSLTHSSNDGLSINEAKDGNKTYWLDITAENLTITSSGEINIDGKGYYGGTFEDDGRGVLNGSDDGGGEQYSLPSRCSGGSGGGFGGFGGRCEYGNFSGNRWSCPTSYRGEPYGSETNVTFLGSGGASSCFGTCNDENSGDGGDGGGLLILEVKNTLNLTGNITSIGGGSSYLSSTTCSGGGSSLGTYGGGGSGGGISIKTSLITGAGLISVKGGASGSTSFDGGGGAGGRILISYSNNYSFTGTIDTAGGYVASGNAEEGDAGSFFNTSFPIVRTVEIIPTTYSQKILKGYCNATEPEGNPISYSWKWYADGVLNESGTTSSYTEGIEVNINNVTTDSSIHKNWTFSCNANTTVESYWKNSTSFKWLDIPNVTTVRITPTTAYTDDILLGYCNTSADPDSDLITYNWKWYNESVTYSSGSRSSFSTAVEINVQNLTANIAKKYQNWTFSCMANDTYSGDWMNETITILNKPPEQPTLNLTEPIYVLQTLNASANTTDADGDSFNFIFKFYNLNDSEELNVIFSTGFESGVMNSQFSNLSNYTGVVGIVDNESCQSGGKYCGEPFKGNYQLRMDMAGTPNEYHHNILYWNNNSISDYNDIKLSFYIKDHGEESNSCTASYDNINNITDCDGVFVKCSDNKYKLVENIDISASNNGVWYYKTYNISQNANNQCGGDGKAYGWAITKYDDAAITGDTTVDGFTIDNLYITGTGSDYSRNNYTIQITDAHDTIRVRTYANDTENISVIREQNITVLNTPPSQDTTIPNQSWFENNDLTLTLSDYFSDLDEDDINYTITPATNLSYNINNITKVITITPDTNFYGTRLVNFTANDTRNTTVSNNVNLTIYDAVTTAELIVPDVTITDYSSGSTYNYIVNATLNNTGFGLMHDSLIYDSDTPNIIDSVQRLDNCDSIVYPNKNCTVRMNITISDSAQVFSYTFTWGANWTNNDTTEAYIITTSSLTITGNPVMELDNHTLLHNTNISSSKIFNYIVNSTGNKDLNHVKLNVTEINSSWFKFNSSFTSWNPTLNEWDPLQDGFAADLEVNVTVTNFTNGTYTGFINITTTEGLNDSINITIIINPLTNQTSSIFSTEGKTLLKNYIKQYKKSINDNT